MQKDTSVNDNRRPTTAVREGQTTKAIEHQTVKIPSSYFLAAAGGAVVLSMGMALMSEKKGWANFVGNWVPSLLLLGVYNKIVKTHGSDQLENQRPLH